MKVKRLPSSEILKQKSWGVNRINCYSSCAESNLRKCFDNVYYPSESVCACALIRVSHYSVKSLHNITTWSLTFLLHITSTDFYLKVCSVSAATEVSYYLPAWATPEGLTANPS